MVSSFISVGGVGDGGVRTRRDGNGKGQAQKRPYSKERRCFHRPWRRFHGQRLSLGSPRSGEKPYRKSEEICVWGALPPERRNPIRHASESYRNAPDRSPALQRRLRCRSSAPSGEGALVAEEISGALPGRCRVCRKTALRSNPIQVPAIAAALPPGPTLAAVACPRPRRVDGHPG